MSSILKALQKLESESHDRDSGPVVPQNLAAGKQYPEKPAWPTNKYLLGLICSGLIVAGIAVFFVSRDHINTGQPVSKPSPVKAIANQRPPDNPVNPAQSRKSVTGVAAAEKSSRPTGVNQIPGKREVRKNTVAATGQSTMAPTPLAASTREARKAGKEGRFSYERPTPKKAVKKESPPVKAGPERLPAQRVPSANTSRAGGQPIPKATASAPRTPTGNDKLNTTPPVSYSPDAANQALPADILQDENMKLHAISWTPDAKTRIAVINGSIVREGDRLNRFQVHRINKDDILLRDKSELWKLVFKTH